MNVSELVAKLSEYPPDLVVSVDGEASGATDHIEISRIKVLLDAGRGMSYSGEHATSPPGEQWDAERLRICRDEP